MCVCCVVITTVRCEAAQSTEQCQAAHTHPHPRISHDICLWQQGGLSEVVSVCCLVIAPVAVVLQRTETNSSTRQHKHIASIQYHVIAPAASGSGVGRMG